MEPDEIERLRAENQLMRAQLVVARRAWRLLDRAVGSQCECSADTIIRLDRARKALDDARNETERIMAGPNAKHEGQA